MPAGSRPSGSSVTFNSIQYAVFLSTFLIVYWSARSRYQNLLVLGASYLFYGWWDWRFCGLLAVSTVVDYTVGLRLAGSDNDRERKLFLAISIATNLGILGFFKYANFFVDSAVSALEAIGLQGNETSLSIILPVGISFYTFQTMSYTIDIYRRRLGATSDFVAFAAFVSFFPQLVAGPIERASALLPQLLRTRERPDKQRVVSSLHLIGLGLIKKVVIADVMAREVDVVYNNLEGASWVSLVVALWAFSLQIYGDFSGYSDIARGSARLLGIELMINFNQPYLSTSITEFWQRWHISLSTWLRDYLYIPFGGNRSGTAKTLRNLMATMLIGGLWHGASWTFVAWGGLHGSLLIAERATAFGERVQRSGLLIRTLARFLVFNVVGLVWVFFRSADFATAGQFLTLIAQPSLSVQDLLTNSVLLLVPALLLMLVIDVAQVTSGSHTPAESWRAPRQGALLGLATILLIVFSGGPAVPFIYFQF